MITWGFFYSKIAYNKSMPAGSNGNTLTPSNYITSMAPLMRYADNGVESTNNYLLEDWYFIAAPGN